MFFPADSRQHCLTQNVLEMNHVEQNHYPPRRSYAEYARPIPRPNGARVCDCARWIRSGRRTSGSTALWRLLACLHAQTCARSRGGYTLPLGCVPERSHGGKPFRTRTTPPINVSPERLDRCPNTCPMVRFGEWRQWLRSWLHWDWS